MRSSNEGKLPSFVRDGLEAHRRATEKVKANALKQLGKPKRDRTILSAIKNKEVLSFRYKGKERIVEPLEKISNLRKAGTVFVKALPEHNPNDSAMVEVFATLPKPKQ